MKTRKLYFDGDSWVFIPENEYPDLITDDSSYYVSENEYKQGK